MESIIEKKSFDFAVRIVNLYKHLTADKKEFVLSKQLLRSGTSIGANVAEGERGQSRPDFNSKMSIALKEATETYYWLRLLHCTAFLTLLQFSHQFVKKRKTQNDKRKIKYNLSLIVYHL